MLKMADSAAIRHHMPTLPRMWAESGISLCGTAIVVAAKPVLLRVRARLRVLIWRI
jgi:hypothetical protein